MRDILFLAHRVPYPPDRGDKMRGYHILERLARHGRVHLIAFADDERDLTYDAALAELTASRTVLWRGKSNPVAFLQSLVRRCPASVSAFAQSDMAHAVSHLLAEQPIDTIYVYSSQMAQYLPAAPTARVVMDFVDMDSAKFAAYARDTRGPMAWLHAREARLLAAQEARIAARADASLFVSDAEAALFRERTGAENVATVENGIDTQHYGPAASFPRIGGMGPMLVFTGQMDYRPNIEAVTWFADRVLPLIRRQCPRARFAVVGRRPADAVLALAARADVMVTGEVDDVRGWIAAASVAVAPLRLARGVQNKVLEAMAMGRPVVASGAAAEGIDHAGTIRVAGEVDEFAAAVAALLDDDIAAEALGAAARARVLVRYGWEARLAPLDALIGAASAANRRTAA